MMASWIVVDKATRKAVLETFERRTAEGFNRERYDVVTVHVYPTPVPAPRYWETVACPT